MFRFALLAVLVLAAALPAQAQTEYPRVEVFGGYSYASIEPGFPKSFDTFSHQNAHGWAASLSVNLHNHFGITADFAGQYGDARVPDPLILTPEPLPRPLVDFNFSAHQFLFGPRIAARTNRVTAFGHALFGVNRSKVSSLALGIITIPGETETDFAMALGGGLDISIGKHVSIRAVQVDYLPVRDDGDVGNPLWLDNIRLQTGVVIKLGSGGGPPSSTATPSVPTRRYPRVEVFGGYSFMRVEGAAFPTPEAGHGWVTSANVNFHKLFGATAEVAGQYGDAGPHQLPEGSLCITTFPAPISCLGVAKSFSAYQFLFGPRVTRRTGRFTGFGHTLFGWNHIRGSGFDVGGFRQSRTDFAMALGGGLDINAGRRFAIRVAQVDYVPVRVGGFRSVWLDNVRVQSGVVIKLGGR